MKVSSFRCTQKATPRAKSHSIGSHTSTESEDAKARFRRRARCGALLAHCDTPMKWVDEIVVDAAGGRAEASLYVSADAAYLADHFPGWPTLPGLLMLETAVQAAAALWQADCTWPISDPWMDRLEELKITRRVVPSETLIVLVQLKAVEEGTASFAARGLVAGESCMRARFRLRAASAMDAALATRRCSTRR